MPYGHLAGALGCEGSPGSCLAGEIDDTLIDYSNWGTAVEMAAPGGCIYSTYPLELSEREAILREAIGKLGESKRTLKHRIFLRIKLLFLYSLPPAKDL